MRAGIWAVCRFEAWWTRSMCVQCKTPCMGTGVQAIGGGIIFVHFWGPGAFSRQCLVVLRGFGSGIKVAHCVWINAWVVGLCGDLCTVSSSWGILKQIGSFSRAVWVSFEADHCEQTRSMHALCTAPHMGIRAQVVGGGFYFMRFWGLKSSWGICWWIRLILHVDHVWEASMSIQEQSAVERTTHQCCLSDHLPNVATTSHAAT
jgi:hypothetical protein